LIGRGVATVSKLLGTHSETRADPAGRLGGSNRFKRTLPTPNFEFLPGFGPLYFATSGFLTFFLFVYYFFVFRPFGISQNVSLQFLLFRHCLTLSSGQNHINCQLYPGASTIFFSGGSAKITKTISLTITKENNLICMLL